MADDVVSNLLYRGPVDDRPPTITATIVGALLPGVLVKKTSTGSLTIAGSGDSDEDLYLLGQREWFEQGLQTAYKTGDSGVAWVLRPTLVYQCRLAAATYAVGDELTVGASGYLTKTVSTGEIVRAIYDGRAEAKTAGQMDDIQWLATGWKK